MADPIQLLSAARAHRDLSHQISAWRQLQQRLSTSDPGALGEFAELFRADPPAKDPSPSPGVDWLTPCLPLVKEFEGCELEAYPDPGTGGDPWTIGWGHTGPEVREGLTWTQQQADTALAADLHEAHAGMLQALPMAVGYSGNRQAALTSWVFNVGAGAAADSTLRKRLAAGEDPATVVREELPRWNKGGRGVMPGLVRRRAAEVELFCRGAAPVDASPGRPGNPLKGFPFFAQQDNGPQGWRQCQTSSIAMCLRYLKVQGIRDDLDYLRVVERYGDTTSQEAHRQALSYLKVRARFRQNLTAGEVQAEIKAGLPAAIGILHHGPVSAPSGGGHYIAVCGFDSTHWIVNDPYGELDLVNGGWSSQAPTAGKGQRYSFRNLNPRFLPEGPASGWGWVFS